MKRAIKTRWLEALRSGFYVQGDEQLCRDDYPKPRYCCLGVLVDIMDAWDMEYPVPEGFFANHPKAEVWYARDDSQVLALDFANDPRNGYPTAGFLHRCGLNYDETITLAQMNDQGKSFKEIADYIEKEL